MAEEDRKNIWRRKQFKKERSFGPLIRLYDTEVPVKKDEKEKIDSGYCGMYSCCSYVYGRCSGIPDRYRYGYEYFHGRRS